MTPDRLQLGRSMVSTADSSWASALVTPHSRLGQADSSVFAQSSLERLGASGVQVMTEAEVVGLGGNGVLDHVLVAVHGQEVYEIPADLLLVGIGQVPDLGELAQWDLNLSLQGSHLPVDSSMRTAVAGVFAAGDFVAYPGKVKMIATAAAAGSTAAASVERYLRVQA